MRTTFRALDAIVGQDAQGCTQLGRAAGEVLCRTADCQNRVTQLRHAGVRLAGRRSHFINQIGCFVQG